MATIKDLYKEAPKKLNDLTKDNMLAYVKTKSDADKKWFKELMIANRKEGEPNPLYKEGGNMPETITKYDMPVIREAFAVKYFYSISKEGRKASKKADKKKPSFEEELAAL